MKFQNQCYMTKKSELATTIFNYHTPEFFINMKDIPPPKSEHRGDFVSEEKRKCREGINVNGIDIPPELYFHLNYYHLQGDSLITGKKEIMLPRLRDNEWIIFNDYHKCSIDKIIYPLFGARQIGKSEIETSLSLREFSIFKETEAMSIFSNSPDRDTFTKKLSTAITHGEKFIIIPNIDKDFSKDEIRFGFTRPDNTTDIRARLYIYNTQDGKKIQIGSGKSVSFLLFDEIGKSNFRRVYDVIEPALLSDTGNLRCAPILAFTGGEVEKGRDAENLVKNPTVKQFKMDYEDHETGEVKVIGGRVLDGLYRKDCKEPVKFANYIGKKTNTWLDDVTIQVSNKEKAYDKIQEERKEAESSTDSKSLTLKKIFYPLNLDDIFLTESNNKFNINALKQHKKFLENQYTPIYADLFRDRENKVTWTFSEMKPITIFPVKPTDNKLAPVIIYEHPIEDVPHGTYCIGIDPIHNDDSTDRITSLGSFTVYKRMINPMDKFKNQVVASWAGRFKSLEEFHDLCILVAEFYNAREGVLIEESERSLIQYFYHKRKSQFLAGTSDLLTHIKPDYKGAARKGLPTTVKNQQHYMNLMVEYTNCENVTVDDEGDEAMELGLSRIFDTMLLEEMIHYKSKQATTKGVHDGNFDRIISFGCALTLAQFYEQKYPITMNTYKEPTVNEIFAKKQKPMRTPFGTVGGKYSVTKPRWLKT